MTIKRGEKVAIVGPSGSGKTTVCDILLGLIEPSSGEVLFDDIPISDWVHSRGDVVAYVPQEIILLDGSLISNICLGIEFTEIDHVRLSEVCRLTHLEALIERLPAGLETRVDADSVQLSGGEKQRIAIARAIYARPSLIIMDEATSALDAQTENELLRTLEAISDTNVTLVFIAHRMNIIQTFQRLLYFENGGLRADGSFDFVRRESVNFNAQILLSGSKLGA